MNHNTGGSKKKYKVAHKDNMCLKSNNLFLKSGWILYSYPLYILAWFNIKEISSQIIEKKNCPQRKYVLFTLENHQESPSTYDPSWLSSRNDSGGSLKRTQPLPSSCCLGHLPPSSSQGGKTLEDT